jgi:hypothetical protein
VPSHVRMRLIDRDLIRGVHYSQRSCEPHLQAEHMAAPTNAAHVKKVLANSEPSTHGTKRHFAALRRHVRSCRNSRHRAALGLNVSVEMTQLYGPAVRRKRISSSWR